MVKHAMRAVVVVTTADGRQGSGFFIGENLVVTSAHVIRAAKGPINVRASRGTSHRARAIAAYNEGMDYAVLRVTGSAQHTLEPAPAGKPADEVYTVGAPLGMARTVSKGVISQYRLGPSGEPLIQHTAPISPGSSGSPLLDRYGRVLGINNFSLPGQEVNFALDIRSVLRSRRTAQRSGLMTAATSAVSNVRSRIEVDLDLPKTRR